jgi:hypothetical protein
MRYDSLIHFNARRGSDSQQPLPGVAETEVPATFFLTSFSLEWAPGPRESAKSLVSWKNLFRE